MANRDPKAVVTPSGYLETLARETDKPESEVIARALEVGLRQLWRERALGGYLREEVSREEAVERVGIVWVELSERQRQAVQEDFDWAMRTPLTW